MKFYLRDDLRYDYKRILILCKVIIALLIMVCIVLIIVISNNDRNMKNNLIHEVSIKNSQTDYKERTFEKKSKEEKSDEKNKSSIINRICESVVSLALGEKNEKLTEYFSNAFKTLDAEDASFKKSIENYKMDCFSIRYEENQLNSVSIDTESKNEEQSSKKEKYLYLIKYKYKNDSKDNYNYNNQRTHISKKLIINNSLKTLTVLSS